MGLGCAPAAWEEHHRLALDGSGQSVILIASDLIPGNRTEDAPGRLREALAGPGVDVIGTSSKRNGHVEAEVAFDSVASLCEAPVFRRECNFRRTEDGGFDLAMRVGLRPGTRPRSGETAEIRVRTEGTITMHNSDGRLQRGNVLSWTRTLDELLSGGFEIRVRTEGTSVFAATTRIVLRSAVIALGIVGIGLSLLLLEGRRRLRRERSGAGG